MACLRQDFDDWAASEPEELESDHPTEKEMVAYDEKEKEHAAKVGLFTKWFFHSALLRTQLLIDSTLV
jgi:hypothetical protein